MKSDLEPSPIAPLLAFGGLGLFTWLSVEHAKKQKAASQPIVTVVGNAGMSQNINPATGFPLGSASDQAVQGTFNASEAVTGGASGGIYANAASQVAVIGSNGG
jgi:hypothetical protein